MTSSGAGLFFRGRREGGPELVAATGVSMVELIKFAIEGIDEGRDDCGAEIE